MRFYGDDLDELHLAFNFVFLLADFEAAQLAPIVAETEALLPEHAWPVWTLRQPRHGPLPDALDARRPRARALRAHAAADAARDAGPLLRRRARAARRRDRARARGRSGRPAQRPRASRAATARARRCRGATSRARASRAPGAEPWLPFGELAGVNVAAQRADPGSPLNLTRDLVALRRAEEDLRAGAYAEVAVDGRAVGLPARRRLPRGAQPRAGRREPAGRGHDRDRHPPRSATARRSRGRCCWRPARASSLRLA